MTNEQMNAITELREQNYGYLSISKATGISRDRIRYYCQNHGLDGFKGDRNPRPIEQRYCFNCGKKLKQTAKGRPAKFCSPECRQKWWNDHPEQVKRRASSTYTYVCPTCGKEFTAYGNSHRKYCSHPCYITGRFGGTHDE